MSKQCISLAAPVAAAGVQRHPDLRGVNLVGRSTELAFLRRRLARLSAEGGSVVIHGAAGVGKSSLLAAAVESARTGGFLVTEALGIESETMAPFAGLEQLLRPLLPFAASVPEVQRRALSTAIGDADGPPPELFLTALAARALIGSAAKVRPVVLVADDLQWIDSSTVEVLAFVARRLQDVSALLLFGLRDGHEVAVTANEAEFLGLSGLDQVAARHLLDRIAGDLAPPERSAILTHAQGNPLALVELPIAWRLARTEPNRVAVEAIPLSQRLERAFAARVGDLPPGTKDALLVCALDSEGLLVEILAGYGVLTGRISAPDILEPAERAGLVHLDEEAVRFRHPLVRSAVVRLASPDQRRRAHRALSQVVPPNSYRRVWHQAQGVDGQDDEVADQLVVSHIESLRRGSVLTAVAALERAAELTTDSGRRGQRLLLAGQHAYSLGRSDLVGRLVAAAERNDLSELEIGRAEWLREIFTDGRLGDSGRIIELCRLAAEARDAGDADLALDLLSSAALRCWWASVDAAVHDLVVEVCESLEEHQHDPRAIAVACITLPVQRGAVTSARLREVTTHVTADPEQMRQLGMAARALGDEPAAAAHFDAAEHILRERGQLALLAHVHAVQAAVNMDLGRWQHATHNLDEASRLGTDTGQPNWRTSTVPLRALLMALVDESEQAFELADEADATSSDRGLRDFLCLAQLARGVASLTEGRPDVAFAQLERVFDEEGDRCHPREQFSGVMFMAEAAAASGEKARARTIVARLEALAAVTPSPILHTHLRYARAVLADDQTAEDLYLEALRQDLTRWPWPKARLQLAYGNWLRRVHRPTESREPVRSSLTTFDAIGARGWARQARAALRAAGENDTLGPAPTAETILSSEELEIVRLAATGLSNREIGERMFLSARTVGARLYRIFPKLGVSFRGQLARRLEDL